MKMLSLQLQTFTFTLFLFWLLVGTHCVSYEEDTTVTKQQAAIFQRFKDVVWNSLPQEWMKDDLFLLRFLRSKNFDVSRAQAMLNTHLRWRKQNSMDSIHQEDWSDFKDYPYDINGRDREGRVVMRIHLDEWDVRKVVAAGKLPRLFRYTWKMWDEGRIKVMELQKQGQNVTRWVQVAKLDNINVVQHVNPASIPYYLGIASAFLPNFPEFMDHAVLINTPALFESVLSLVRPLLGDLLRVYGRDKRVWKPILDKSIDPSQLPPSFGGTAAELR